MRIIKFLLSLSITITLVWALNRHWVIMETVTNPKTGEVSHSRVNPPKFGQFLSPFTGFWQNAEGEKPDLPTTIYSDKLSAPVTVHYDEYMVPHIFAENDNDAAFAQGYITAFFRLWQMEFQTHAAAGRLSEILGKTGVIDSTHECQCNTAILAHDQDKRDKGMVWAAKRAIEEWKKYDEYKTIEAYSDGINTYIESLSYADYPIEYKVLNYEPEAWSPLKTALLLKKMAETLTDRNEDFQQSNAYHLFGKDKFKSLYPEYFLEQSPIVQDSGWAFVNPTPPTLPVEPMLLSEYVPYKEPRPKGIGSNNWAVAGSKTASGNPILCNDPHLGLNLPSIWFMVQIHTPEYNVYGASLPGAPGVVSGFNNDVAWGVTNVGLDVQDWYKVEWKDNSQKEYMFDSTYRAATHLYDTIHIKGGAMVIDTLIYTHIGPIAYSHGGNDFALRWTAHDPSLELLTLLQLCRAKDYEDYTEAIKYFHCPAQNVVFAAKDGDIALWTQGKWPIRKNQQGRFVQDGTKSLEQWQGFIPQQLIPHEHNPGKGYVGSANQHSTRPNYPYYYHGYYEEFRGRHLNQSLAAMNNITVEDMMRLQQDNYSVKGEDLLPYMMMYTNRANLKKEELEVINQLAGWDYVYRYDSPQPTIFETWLYELKNYLYEELGSLNEKHNLTGQQALLRPSEAHLVNILKRDTANFIIDNTLTANQKENIYDVVTESFKNACKVLPMVDGKIANWVDMQGARTVHMARMEPFSFYDLKTGGSGSALNAVATKYSGYYDGEIQHRAGSSFGPSWRMIVELGDDVVAHCIYPGGQSGNPGSIYYSDMLPLWETGKYHQVLFMQSKDEASEKLIFRQDFVK